MSNLLARYAASIFWLARYVERAEDLARILDVNETFSRDSRGGQNWRSILQLYADDERFFAANPHASAAEVIHFYTLDAGNPSSIVSSIRAARENARTLRPLISTEMWTQLNIFYNRLRAMTREDLAEPRLARFCSFIKEGCQTHTGITEGTFYRDEGWYFYQLGRSLERADQTTRLLEVKYHLLLPSSQDVGSPFDVSQWNAVLRSAAGFHAFRRLHPSGMTAANVAGFLLLHLPFPRSVHACVHSAAQTLEELREGYALTGGADALEQLHELRAMLRGHTAAAVVQAGLHELLDDVQARLNAVSAGLASDFFGLGHAAAAE
ncbi:alpha-E domain-containing protein [Ferruginivarius sediminum]|uniref:Alpha-E domain-containing protein n=1 Tax=Ferruginivarius sediminum TaxID=2661937 RepID=A0A369T5P6_9PROT|nr:alpha-E domain-containing protein [Ferruginivarius sediminum]RDD60643.1 alpha-E domain-containing protein [Ferruginivarius sediminum]